MNRDSIIMGAARIIFNAPAGASTFYSAADQAIKIPLKPETFKVAPEGYAHMSTRLKDLVPRISVTPDGRFDAALIAALWPFANAAKNARIFSNTDRTLLFHTQESHLYTATNAAVAKMPQINFSPVKTLVGPVEFVVLRGNGVAWDTANSLITHAASGGTFVDSTYASSQIKTQPYTANWGSVTGFTSIETFGDEGFVFTPILEVSPVVLSGARTYNFFIKEIGAKVSFRPANPTQAQILTNMAIQGTGNLPGKELGTGADLTITGADGINYCILKNAVPEEGGFAFGGEPRNDMMSFVAQPLQSSGAQAACFVLAAS